MEDCCKLNWVLLLEYIKVLIWPIISLILILIFKDDFETLIKRIAQSKSIKTPIFEAQLSEAVTGEIEKVDSIKNQEKSVETKNNQISLHSILIQATDFMHQELPERRRRARVIYREALNISEKQLDKILNSLTDENRIAALIAIKSKIDNIQIDISEKNNYLDLINTSLDHPNSLVRYRAVETINGSSYLKDKFKDKLKEIQKNEQNPAVNMFIRMILK